MPFIHGHSAFLTASAAADWCTIIQLAGGVVSNQDLERPCTLFSPATDTASFRIERAFLQASSATVQYHDEQVRTYVEPGELSVVEVVAVQRNSSQVSEWRDLNHEQNVRIEVEKQSRVGVQTQHT